MNLSTHIFSPPSVITVQWFKFKSKMDGGNRDRRLYVKLLDEVHVAALNSFGSKCCGVSDPQ